MSDVSDGPRVEAEGPTVASSAEDLFAANDRPVIRYPVEEWGGLVVCLRAPTMAAVLGIGKLEDEEQQVARLFEIGIVSPDGGPILDGAGVARLFEEKSASSLTEIAKKLKDISGLSEDAEATSEGN